MISYHVSCPAILRYHVVVSAQVGKVLHSGLMPNRRSPHESSPASLVLLVDVSTLTQCAYYVMTGF